MVACWKEVKARLRESLDRNEFDNWIKGIELTSIDGATATVEVASNFTGEYITSTYTDLILKSIQESGENVLALKYAVKKIETRGGSRWQRPEPQLSDPEHGLQTTNLDSKFTFATFVVGESNSQANEAALQIACSKIPEIGSLYLYGNVGLGKTHLLNAVAWMIMSRDARANVKYMTGELFTSQFVLATRSGKILEFRKMLRSVDILLVDDIQFIAGKQKTTLELELTFDDLMRRGKLIVLSGQSSVGEMTGLGNRLESRIQQGLAAMLSTPNFELRLRIAQATARVLKDKNPKLEFEEGVLEFVARNITNDIRRLQGALRRLAASSSFLTNRITIEEATHTLSDLVRISQIQPSMQDIANSVAKFYGISQSDILGKSRLGNIARARQIGIYLTHQLTRESFSNIGRHFNRDHTTVSYSIQRIKGLCKTDSNVVKQLDAIKRELNQY